MVEKSRRRRRYCPLCRAPVRTKTGTGHYVCTSGHQFSGYQEEEGEFDATMGSMHERRRRALKRGRESKSSTIFFGAQLDHLFLQSIQLVLRKQLYALIHDLGFPAELEQVGFEYWTLYISKLATYRGKETSTVKATQREGPERNSEQESHDEDERTGDHIQDEHSDALDKMDEFLQQDFNSSSEEEDNGHASDDNDGDGDGDGDDDGDDDVVVETASGGGGGRGKSHTGRGSKVIWNEANPHALRMTFTIAICYLSALHLQLPVVIGDFYRWVMDRKLPYYNALYSLPQEMIRRHNHRWMLLPKHRAVKTFGEAVRKLSDFYSAEFKLPRAPPNRPSLIFRFLQQLMLPVEVYPSALQLCSAAADPRKTKYERRTFDDTILTMAHVIIIAKLFFGLDGKTRFDGDWQSIVNLLPRERDWMQSLDIYDSLQTQTQIPMAFGEFEELIQVNPDLYSEFCKQELHPDPKQEFAQVLSCLEGTDYAQRLSEQQTETKVSPPIETFIRRLYIDVAPPEGDYDEEDWLEPPPLLPGEGFVHYLPDRSGKYLGNYERLLGYACNILGVRRALLEEAVILVEKEVVKAVVGRTLDHAAASHDPLPLADSASQTESEIRARYLSMGQAPVCTAGLHNPRLI
ncbi:unnamed protein product [Mortierella alpina]